MRTFLDLIAVALISSAATGFFTFSIPTALAMQPIALLALVFTMEFYDRVLQ